jgi:parallel beta-helix repeat protein
MFLLIESPVFMQGPVSNKTNSRRFIMKRIAVLLSAMFFVAITLCGCKGPMIITGNFMLKLMADSGSGTEANPYIIENKEIDMTGKNANAGIQLQYTTAHVILRNIKVLNGVDALNNLNESDRANNLGIFLQFVSNATIEKCHLENNNMGMWLEGCQAVSVIGNTVIDNRYRGIYLMDSSYSIIEENTVDSDNPLYSDNILLNTNFLKPASVCSYNQVKNNETKAIRLQGSMTIKNTIYGNTWDGSPSSIIVGSEVGENFIY